MKIFFQHLCLHLHSLISQEVCLIAVVSPLMLVPLPILESHPLVPWLAFWYLGLQSYSYRGKTLWPNQKRNCLALYHKYTNSSSSCRQRIVTFSRCFFLLHFSFFSTRVVVVVAVGVVECFFCVCDFVVDLEQPFSTWWWRHLPPFSWNPWYLKSNHRLK